MLKFILKIEDKIYENLFDNFEDAVHFAWNETNCPNDASIEVYRVELKSPEEITKLDSWVTANHPDWLD